MNGLKEINVSQRDSTLATIHNKEITKGIFSLEGLTNKIFNINGIFNYIDFPGAHQSYFKAIDLSISKFKLVCKEWNLSIPSRLDFIFRSLTPEFVQQLLLYKNFCNDNCLNYIDDYNSKNKTTKFILTVQQYTIGSDKPAYEQWITPFNPSIQLNYSIQRKNPIEFSNNHALLSTWSRGRNLNQRNSNALASHGIIEERDLGFNLERTCLLPISLLMQMKEKPVDRHGDTSASG